ncbi:hypothetical protein U5B43_01715 [Campylobacter sp. 9BO]|uniref:hypothetical protein n=1 Tax=Campylobacter sp. 9BO TaxID=3424759 RepID=UPI003D33CE10
MALWRLCRSSGSIFLSQISARFYSDYTFGLGEIGQGAVQIQSMINKRLAIKSQENELELSLLYKIWAILLFAVSQEKMIFCSGD